MHPTLILLLFTVGNSGAALFYDSNNDILTVFTNNNSTFKYTNASFNTTTNINCTNFQYNVSCRSLCKPPQQVCPSQAGPNSTSAYNTFRKLQQH
jgi:hypothetical protein